MKPGMWVTLIVLHGFVRRRLFFFFIVDFVIWKRELFWTAAL